MFLFFFFWSKVLHPSQKCVLDMKAVHLPVAYGPLRENHLVSTASKLETGKFSSKDTGFGLLGLALLMLQTLESFHLPKNYI